MRSVAPATNASVASGSRSAVSAARAQARMVARVDCGPMLRRYASSLQRAMVVSRSAADLGPADDLDGRLEVAVVAVGQRRLRPVGELDLARWRHLAAHGVIVDASRAVVARMLLVLPEPRMVEGQPHVAETLARVILE